MSQWGALGKAADGSTYSEILNYYYPGTALAYTNSLSTQYENVRVGLLQDVTALAIRGEKLGGTGGVLTVTVGTISRDVPAETSTTIELTSGQALVKLPGGEQLVGSQVDVRWNGTTANASAASVVNVASGVTATAAVSALGTLCSNVFAGATPVGSCNHRYKYGSLTINAGAFGENIGDTDYQVDLNVVLAQRLDDEYIKGIGEVSSSWPEQALKSQAVAARSYALASAIAVQAAKTSIAVSGYPKKVKQSCLCQVYATTVDQNYAGFSKEFESAGSRWINAVTSTMSGNYGQVIMGGGSVVKAFYSSSTGGTTQPVSQVWGSTSMPWLASVADPWSLRTDIPGFTNPNISWSRTISQASVKSSLNSALAKAYTSATKAGKSCTKVVLPDVASLAIGATYSSGAISVLNIADSGGNTYQIDVRPGTGCTALNPDKIRSTLGVKSTQWSAISESDGTVAGSSTTRTKLLSRVAAKKWPARLTKPAAYTFSGSVVPKQFGVQVSVREFVGGKWRILGSTTTTAGGTWKWKWNQPSVGVHSVRVYAKNSKNTKRTATRKLTVVGSVQFTATTPVAVGNSSQLSGSVTPATLGVKIVIERKSLGRWRQIATTTTDASGMWSTDISVGNKPGKLVLRARTTNKKIGAVSSKTRSVISTKS